jgi:hypothetical protein
MVTSSVPWSVLRITGNPSASEAFEATGGRKPYHNLIVASARQEGAMKRMLILAVTLWLDVSATAHAQVNSPTNAASTVTGAIVPSGQGVTGATGGGFSAPAPVRVLCPFGVSLSANLTAFGCASDPLGAPTYQISAGAGVVITGPVGSISANAQTVTPNATSGAGGAGAGVSSSAGCLGAIPSTAGSAVAGDLFGGIGRC